MNRGGIGRNGEELGRNPLVRDFAQDALGFCVAKLRLYPLRGVQADPFHTFGEMGQGKDEIAVVNAISGGQYRFMMREPIAQ